MRHLPSHRVGDRLTPSGPHREDQQASVCGPVAPALQIGTVTNWAS